MKACLIKTLLIHVYVLEIGQRLVSRKVTVSSINFTASLLEDIEQIPSSTYRQVDKNSEATLKS